MGELYHVYVFGDSTFDYGKALCDLVHLNSDPLVISFFEKTYYALRAEIGVLPEPQRRVFQQFANFSELAAQSLSGSLHPSLEEALTCAYQLASFISDHSQDRSYPKAVDSLVIGVSAGGLAAAAICSSTTVSNLLPAAVHSVVVAFRTGLCAMEVGRTLVPDKELTGDWSVMCPLKTPEEAHEAIEAFSEATHLPLISQPFVSACTGFGVAISGPPSTLRAMCESRFLAKFSTSEISSKVPSHAPHLFSDDNINSILSSTVTDRWEAQVSTMPTISSATGEFSWASDFESLLRAGVENMLTKPLRWDLLKQRLASITGSKRAAHVIIHHIAVSTDGVGWDTLRQDQPTPQLSSLNPTDSKPQREASIPSTSHFTARPDKSKIAVIGLSGRFPGAEDMPLFWDLLHEGRDVHKVVPPLHWNAETHVDPTGKIKNTSATPFGCWLDHPEVFDAKFFNISPREAPQIDPAQRLALLTAYEAIEQAGLVPGATPSTQKDRVGVFFGVTSNDWMETNSAQNIDAYFIPGGNRAFIPGRINYFFNFSGPSLSVDTACSSSLASMHMACNALWGGEIDTAIAGGTNVLTNPDFTAGLDRGHFLSRTGNCKTFDDGADGYCRGEGVVTVILKRLEDAIADKDPIQSVILGACTNHSAEAESITRPLVAAQKDIFRKVLDGAGVDPLDVGYVEMHGTGTQAGDAAEIQSVVEVFAPDNARGRRAVEQPLYVGSAKANIGHGEAASGVASLAKLLLMMKNNVIPPHCGIKTKINHTFPKNLKDRQVFIAKKPTPWKRPHEGVRKSFLNNFSAAGGNTAILLEDAPVDTIDEIHDHRSCHVVAVSAKCAASLQGNASALLLFLDKMRADELPCLSWTTTARRIHHRHRIMVYGESLEKIKAGFRRAIEAKEGASRPKSAPKVLFAFTGQGSAYPGMAKQLFEEIDSFRSDINRFDRIARSLGFPSFKHFFAVMGGDSSNHPTLISQLAIVCLEMALAQLWISWGIEPHSVVGHSLGEYAALNVAGVLSDSDTIYLVGKRAQLLQRHCRPETHAMLAIRANLEWVQSALKGKTLEVACVNSPEDVVISGGVEEIRDAQQLWAARGLKTTLLKIPYAFHSAQVDPILTEFEQAAGGVSFYAPTIPVLDSLHANHVRADGVFGPSYLSQHCRRSVDILGAIRAAQKNGIITDKSLVLEIGPQPIVSAMFKSTMPQVQALPSLRHNADTWEVIAKSISVLYNAGADVSWREYHRDFRSSQKVLQLPMYQWDLKPYWMQYVNDWSLRKGDPARLQPVPAQEATPAELTFPTLESTTIHKIVEETVHDGEGKIVVESDISRPDLNPMVQGHKVNGVPLCTPSVYADIALSIGKYLQDRYWPQMKTRGVVVSDVVIEKALIAAPRGPQLLRTIAHLQGDEKKAKCYFLTVEASGKKKSQHANCSIHFSDPAELRDLQRQVPTLKARMESLRKDLETGKTYIFNKPMIYKMVATLADFDPNYKAIDEIILDSSAMEASSVANFRGIKSEGIFHTSPAFIDALSQSAGFVMNANDRSNLEVEVFVNHGWESFQLFEKLSPQKSYQTHVAMSESAGKMWRGDILVLDGENVVASFKGIALQGVARRLLHYILSTESTAQSGSSVSKDASKVAKPSSKVTRQPQQGASPSDLVEASDSKEFKTKSPTPLATPNVEQAVASREPPMAKRASLAENHGSSTLITNALRIVSEESGIASEELGNDSVLSDVGIDSLLGLMISSRFRDELDVNIDSAVLLGLATIKELKSFLAPTHNDTVFGDVTGTVPSPVTEFKRETQTSNQVDSLSRSDSLLDTLQLQPDADIEEKAPSKGAEGPFSQALQIISEETGIGIDEFVDETAFADTGIDSLLSLMISSRLRDELDVKFTSEGELFATCHTVGDLKTWLQASDSTLGICNLAESLPADEILVDEGNTKSVLANSVSSTSAESLASEVSDAASPDDSDTSKPSDDEDFIKIPRSYQATRRATSVILQGRPWVNSKTLFMFPDGAGSASSYTNLPKLHTDIALIGLNCPYVRHPREMTCSLDELIKSYLDEVRRRQPRGPYHFGGWSSGGIFAYRATENLIREGEEVESLILIDSPEPKGLDRLPQRFYDHCNAIGVFGKAMPGASTSPPAHVFEHFKSTIEVLHNYHARPLPAGRLARVLIVWATESVMDGQILPKLPPGPDDTEGMKFLTEKRTDFSASGWKMLFPGALVDVKRIPDAHHFSMMQHMPQAQKLSEFICSAVRS